jgi:hypothetical protein
MRLNLPKIYQTIAIANAKRQSLRPLRFGSKAGEELRKTYIPLKQWSQKLPIEAKFLTLGWSVVSPNMN